MNEAPSETDVRAITAQEHPTTYSLKYTPDARWWAKVPAGAVYLNPRPLRLLTMYSAFADKSRIAVVSDDRIAHELGWGYTSKKTGRYVRDRQRVWAVRKELEDPGCIVPAGHRMWDDHWINAFLVAPYTAEQLAVAHRWRLQDLVSQVTVLRRSTHGLVRPLDPTGAAVRPYLVRP